MRSALPPVVAAGSLLVVLGSLPLPPAVAGGVPPGVLGAAPLPPAVASGTPPVVWYSSSLPPGLVSSGAFPAGVDGAVVSVVSGVSCAVAVTSSSSGVSASGSSPVMVGGRAGIASFPCRTCIVRLTLPSAVIMMCLPSLVRPRNNPVTMRAANCLPR